MHHTMRGMALATALVLALFLALYPAPGMALGLGRLKVHSALNEPLNAEIDILSISEKELKGLTVGLATRAEYEQAGMDRPAFLSQIKFSISRRLDGRYFIQLRSDEPIREPFLHLLLRFEWPGSRLVREYTALIDPPLQVAGRPAGIEVPTAAASVAPLPAPAPAAEPAAPAAAVTPAEVAPPAEASKPAEVAKQSEPLVPLPVPAPSGAEELLGPPNAGGGIVISKETGWPEEVKPKVEALAPSDEEKAVAPAVAEPQPVVSAVAWSKVKEYTVKRGDTLWHIAERIRVDDSLSLQQVILAIYNANRHAFFGNNVNNLKAGQILRMPERADVESLSVAQARKEFRAHYDVWQEYKLKLAASSRTLATPPEPAAPAKPTETAKTAPAAKAAVDAEKTSATTGSGKATPSDELLKIVRANLKEEKGKAVAEGESAKDTASKEREALAERVTTLEESLASKEMENRALAEKVGQVRAQLKNQARLLELENKELAVAQAQIQPSEPQAAPTPSKPEAPKPAESPITSPPPAAASKPAPVEAAPAPKPAAPPPPPKPAAAPPPPPPQEPGFVAAIVNALSGDLLLPVILGVVVVAVGGIALVYLYRRRQSIAEFEESILASEAISTDAPVTTDTAGQQAITTGDTSFLSDFSQGGMGNVHTDEVDPIAEAEVYLAYGRDETAEEILKEAIVKNPERHELKLKLLEIYHQRNDVGAFERLAEELYAALGGRGGKIWDRVEEMGRKLNPENPMFRGGAPAGKTAAAAAPVSSAPAAAASPAAAGAAVAASAPAAAPAKPDTLFDFDIKTPSPAAPAASETTFDLDFEPTRVATQVAAPAAAASTEAASESPGIGAPAAGANLVEFDLGEPAPGIAGAESAEIKWDVEVPAGPSPVGMEAGTAGGDVTSGETTQHWDETATKLDLAKAYIDMGDAEGARSILEEVMAEGTEQQKQQAKELAAQIA